MNINVNIIDKPNTNITEYEKIKTPEDVIKIKDVQAIRNAIREHLLFIGLNNQNEVINTTLLGIGTTNNIIIDTKEIIRNALFTASDKVILVHNHPSNSLKPSKDDIYMSNITNQILKVFSIEMLDHVIVTKNDYLSMNYDKFINKNYEDSEINTMTKGFLFEENQKLKQEIQELKEEIEKYKNKDFEKEDNEIAI